MNDIYICSNCGANFKDIPFYGVAIGKYLYRLEFTGKEDGSFEHIELLPIYDSIGDIKYYCKKCEMQIDNEIIDKIK